MFFCVTWFSKIVIPMKGTRLYLPPPKSLKYAMFWTKDQQELEDRRKTLKNKTLRLAKKISIYK